MHVQLLIGALIFLIAMTVGSHAVERTTVTRQQVLQALRESSDRELFDGVEERDLVVPSVPLRLQSPDLRVVRLTRAPGTGAFAQLRCLRRACLPFVVQVPCGPACAAKMSTQYRRKAVAGKVDPVLRRGQSATLFLTAPGVRITMPVVCLGAGSRGETIKVFSASTRKVFLAKIEGDGLLAGDAGGGTER